MAACGFAHKETPMYRQLLTAALVLAAPAPAVDNKKDTELIQGTWTVVSYEYDGRKKPDGEIKHVKIVIKDHMITIKRDGVEEMLTFKLDPAKKPKTIDMTARKTAADQQVPGIYELKENELKMCFVKGEKRNGTGARPTEFASKADTDSVLIILKREKKDK